MSDGRVHPPAGEILVYEDPDGSVRVEARLDQETVWLSLTQMSELFQRDKSVVSRHLGNVFRSGELEREAVVAKNATTAADGKTYQVEFFNLDAILSVGYRVNSKRGTQFRIWASHVLRDHLVRGYTLNERRLAERGLQEARDTLELLASTLQNQALVDVTGQAVLELIRGYADTWRLLLEYDEDRLVSPPGARPAIGVLDLATTVAAITEFKRELIAQNEASALFGNPRGEALDGNKRIGSLLFLLYLKQEGIAHRLNPQALTALTLLIAESAPPSKDLMIRLIVNLIAEPETKTSG